MSKKISIYCYEDYRLYLKEIFLHRQSKVSSYSYRKFSKDLGFSSSSYLLQIIKGKKKLGKKGVDILTRCLDLDKTESYYLLILTKLETSSMQEKEALLNVLAKMKIPTKNYAHLTKDQEYYLENRMCSLVPLMIKVYGDDFRCDPYWISRKLRFNFPIKEIDAALSFLMKEGFIYQADGVFKVKYRGINTSKIASTSSFLGAQVRLMEESKVALGLPKNEREFSHSTLLIPNSSIPIVKEKIVKMQNDFQSWVLHSINNEGDHSDKNLAVLNIQFYVLLEK